jgi:hypothetical protein
MHIRLGYVNPQQLQTQKLKVLAKEINDARKERLRGKRLKCRSKQQQEAQTSTIFPALNSIKFTEQSTIFSTEAQTNF